MVAHVSPTVHLSKLCVMCNCPKVHHSLILLIKMLTLWMLLKALKVLCLSWCLWFAQLENPLYVNFGPVVALWSPTGHMAQLLCSVWQAPKCPIQKIQYVLIVALWLLLEASLAICKNWCVWCGRPNNAQLKKSVYVNYASIVSLWSPTGHMPKLVCLVWPAQKFPIQKSSICK